MFYSLFQALLRGTDYDYEEVDSLVIDILDCMNHNIVQNKKQLKYEWEQLLLEYQRCPECANQLEYKEVDCNETEFWGRLVKETFYEKRCPSCGWSDERLERG